MKWLGMVGLLILGLAMVGVNAQQLPLSFGMVDMGFSDFRTKGYEQAFRTWSYGGPLEQDQLFSKRVVKGDSYWKALGCYQGYTNVQTVQASSLTTIYTLTAQFDRGEVFFRFVVFQGKGRYSITSLAWSTDPSELTVGIP